MMANIIIKGKTKMGRTRSEMESNIRKEWGPTMTDKQLSKLKFLENKAKEITGTKDNFASLTDVDNVR